MKTHSKMPCATDVCWERLVMSSRRSHLAVGACCNWITSWERRTSAQTVEAQRKVGWDVVRIIDAFVAGEQIDVV